ncbi:MAG TPA: hypothetical protein VGM95_04910 [Lactobacillaceae bacterium]|jgi:hypothetical protein
MSVPTIWAFVVLLWIVAALVTLVVTIVKFIKRGQGKIKWLIATAVFGLLALISNVVYTHEEDAYVTAQEQSATSSAKSSSKSSGVSGSTIHEMKVSFVKGGNKEIDKAMDLVKYASIDSRNGNSVKKALSLNQSQVDELKQYIGTMTIYKDTIVDIYKKLDAKQQTSKVLSEKNDTVDYIDGVQRMIYDVTFPQTDDLKTWIDTTTDDYEYVQNLDAIKSDN